MYDEFIKQVQKQGCMKPCAEAVSAIRAYHVRTMIDVPGDVVLRPR